MNRRAFFSFSLGGMVAAMFAPLMKAATKPAGNTEPLSSKELREFWRRISRESLAEEVPYLRLEAELKQIDHRLFLLRNRGQGNCVFSHYDMGSGCPTTNQVIYVIREGHGQCEQLNGGPLPLSGIHGWGHGWGASVVRIEIGDRESDVRFNVLNHGAMLADLLRNFA